MTPIPHATMACMGSMNEEVRHEYDVLCDRVARGINESMKKEQYSFEVGVIDNEKVRRALISYLESLGYTVYSKYQGTTTIHWYSPRRVSL